ncbi:penicillin-binding transpeptidase domain-containing protein [Paraflavitalea sp. CAU 1676]|uniref:penicillin-binding transpeptidase domain-containing protein n=1 Tax=Paraflavitalea sp. CAU 1676 TaxID=3032598 RepID=UPI0023DB108D|nr:penicillin-binding transpeptidase domain-containing protein [Paraflavitalea sp. CAU 1676]MDF2187008.1 penicillin-binding transpeptidase domain-containing protein [Paraflavitalea sp. CAU 1676]
MSRWILCSLVSIFFFACSPNNVEVDNDLKKYFDENKVDGTFGMFDNGQGRFTVYNLPRFSDSAYTPASTFKIINSLIGLETGRVLDSSAIINWDSIDRGRPECNRNMTMRDAFRISCPPWYQELARRIGKPAMQKWLDTLGYASRYGKFTIGNNLDTFWLDNSAKVTADEELGIVKKLYFDQLPFQKRSQRIVREMMEWEKNANYSLYYKTGWGFTEKGHALGWIVGWIEENQHPYFFALQLESPDKNYNMKEARIKILKGILKQYGFMEGKK